MFDLEQSIIEWRRQMRQAGIKSSAVLDELEAHLRENIELQVLSGLDDQAAFAAASQQIGPAAVLQDEFSKARDNLRAQWQRQLLIFAGFPSHKLITNMNTTQPNINLEPRWATYLKGAVFGLPAVFLWLFSVVFLAPKVQEMCQQSGTTLFTFKSAPGVFTASAFVGRGMFFLTQHGLVVAGVALLLLFLLEWRSDRWPRHRRAAVGAGTFLLNLAVLISLTLLVVTAIVNAANFAHVK